MNIKNEYLQQARGLEKPERFEGRLTVGWKSPSNIALVKYWGKMEGQLPRNPSISFSLSESCTETTVEYSMHDGTEPVIEFLFEGEKNGPFENRVGTFIRSLTPYLPFLNNLHLNVSSTNSFPHSAGIASSASAMSALALCLAGIENDLFGSLENPADFYRKAAFLARLGSGSATRSVYGGFVIWGTTPAVLGSNEEAGVPWTLAPGNSYLTLKDAIMITSVSQKKISSSHGHGMMDYHPWAEARYGQARKNLEALLVAMESENDKEFIGIIENEALSLHALMLSSDPGYRLMNANTWQIIDRIREFRDKTGTFVTFTLDAGPNVHLIYKQKDSDKILEFIDNQLLKYCDHGRWINDSIGNGPENLRLG